MEHILQFAISIDDEAIEEKAYNKATGLILDDLKRKIYTEGYYSGLTDTAQEAVKKAVDCYKDEIIDKAAKMLTDSIKRSKAWKEKFGEVMEE